MDNASLANLTNLTSSYGSMNCNIYSETAKVFKILGYIFIMLFSLIGNIIVIAVFVRGRERRTLDPFIINIAVSDLLIPVFAVIRELNTAVHLSDVWRIQGNTGEFLCKMVSFLADISPIVSIVTLCCIVLYQFIFVTFIIKNSQVQNSPRRKYITAAVIAFTWLVAVGFNAHYFKTFKLQQIGNDKYCRLSFDDMETYRAYLISACSIFIVIPFVLIAILNSFVAYKVRKELKRSAASFPQWQRNHIQKQKRNQILVIMIISAFALCWGPLGIIIWMYAFKWYTSHYTCSYVTFHFVALFMAHSNSAINPWIYLFFFVFPRRFRNGIAPLNPVSSLTRRRKARPANTAVSGV